MPGISRSESDLLLLHAPSVYDFRKRAILYGPVSDMVPSSTVFEMYPLGFLTMASYLHDRGLNVRIVNLALRMMNSRRFDVPRFLARQTPKAVGIDLHWLPHAHGALEVARIVKRVHPDVPVIMALAVSGGVRDADRLFRASQLCLAHALHRSALGAHLELRRRPRLWNLGVD